MGVTGLWTILHPCARPIKLETLNRKRLAVDASIWIYQFLKAVRDKEGNALRNSHVVGFFRRICKLLFFGIRPVFVFDGGAPVLKRQTVSDRRRRREGRREDAVRTAGRLLAIQMQRRAEEDEIKRKEQPKRRDDDEEEPIPEEGLVYVDEIHMTQHERQQNRKFHKKDAYHLPDMDVSLSAMGGPNDPRIMSLEELQAYAKQFETGEDINVYDFSAIDFDSPFFVSLPASDRYNILNAARLRSRLRMGHSKEQLDSMFPDRMAFSRFQIDRVRERNELTQRLMHLNEGGDTLFNTGRVAGEKGREYVLVRNEGAEGGWALGVISDEGTKQETAIDVDKPMPNVLRTTDMEEQDEDDFEDVPIEGLNRLPKLGRSSASANASARRARRSGGRRIGRSRKDRLPHDDPNSLFVPDASAEESGGDQLSDDHDDESFGSESGDDEDEEAQLKRAMAMSLEEASPTQEDDMEATIDDANLMKERLDSFQQTAAPETKTLPKGSGRAIANIVNKRAYEAAPESREITSFGVPAPRLEEETDEEDSMDLQAALVASRKAEVLRPSVNQRANTAQSAEVSATEIAKRAGFQGPLPFKKLDLGTSLLGKKKMQQRAEDVAGGFENPELASKDRPEQVHPAPPWFSSDLDKDLEKQRVLENADREHARQFQSKFQFQSVEEKLGKHDTSEIIDLDASDEETQDGKEQSLRYDPRLHDVLHLNEQSSLVEKDNSIVPGGEVTEPVNAEVSDHSDAHDAASVRTPKGSSTSNSAMQKTQGSTSTMHVDKYSQSNSEAGSDNEPMLEWSVSPQRVDRRVFPPNADGDVDIVLENTRSPSVEFEDVVIPDKPTILERDATAETAPIPDNFTEMNEDHDIVQEDLPVVDDGNAEFDDFSDPEDEELLHALAQEAEEHARFASTLNNKTQAQNIADYEKELKQLRNQQKKDRRDADEITQVMIQECQELLKHFGLPYITAPMEAEAQCAELVRLGLVDGIVTDDSDCFLFGGTRIYKNMFNQAKFVECYLTSDLEKEFDLDRQKLIQIAHLLGSDYTEGLPGVGPVTALEILGEFQTLEDFKAWFSGVQMNAISKSEDASKPFRKKFRKMATKLFLPPIFPDLRVDAAYLEPEVDSDPEQFQWGVPDLIALRAFLMATIGWSEERTDEVLVPVIRDMNHRADEGTQSNITAFFDGGVGVGAAKPISRTAGLVGEAYAPRKRIQGSSKRMGNALTRMAEQAKIGRADTTSSSKRQPSNRISDKDESMQPSSRGNVTAGKTKRGAKRTMRSESHHSTDDERSEQEQKTGKKARKTARSRGDGRGRDTASSDDQLE